MTGWTSPHAFAGGDDEGDEEDEAAAEEGEGVEDYLCAKMHLVDLAGSERAKRTKAEGTWQAGSGQQGSAHIWPAGFCRPWICTRQLQARRFAHPYCLL